MAGGTIFSKIDLLQAYLQLEIRPEDRELLTLNTHKGLYRPTRLMYGIASAPAIWQRTIENILKDIPGVVVFLDDIRVSGTNMQDHLQKLRQVFSRLQKYNIRINVKKSEFLTDRIHYCGYVIDKNGINKASDKIEAIANMPKPTNITELRSFLGMVHYYDRFVPNLSAILQPLNRLLEKNVKFHWSVECERSFQAAKKAFTSQKCLVHFDPSLPITLATDASSYGVGAVLSHIYPDGTERAIQYASQTLSKTQRSYSQIDKEAYAIIYGVKKFHQYLLGAKFTLITDHRPLTQIFSPTKGLPVHTAMRMQHYALILQGYNYNIKYRKSELHSNADCLSRLPTPRTTDEMECEAIDEFQEATFNTLPITATQVAAATSKDKELSKLLDFLTTGSGSAKNNKFFTVSYKEFSLLHGVIFRGHRVVIPVSLQKKILHELHLGHFGMIKMKHLARGYVWWHKIDSDIEKLAQNCYECNSHRNNPPQVTNHIWEPAQTPFERVHADFAGPFLGHYFFILIDAFTKWPEIHIVKDIKANTTINICRQIFYTYGLPKYFVSDNGTTFTSQEFTGFLKSHGIIPKYTAPYHPATNGQAERYVQILKNALRKMQATHANAHINLQKLLFRYRNIVHSTTGASPAEMLFSRKIRTHFDLLRPSNPKHTVRYTPPFNFTVGKRVSCRNYAGKIKWLFGKVIEQSGQLHFKIRLDDGRIWKRHINQMRPIGNDTPKNSEEDPYDYYEFSSPSVNNNASNNTTDTTCDTNNGTNVNASRSQASTSSSSRTLVDISNNTTPTAPEANSSTFSTPQGSWLTSTPNPSSPISPAPEVRDTTPSIKGALRSPRLIRAPRYLEMYETKMPRISK